MYDGTAHWYPLFDWINSTVEMGRAGQAAMRLVDLQLLQGILRCEKDSLSEPIFSSSQDWSWGPSWARCKSCAARIFCRTISGPYGLFGQPALRLMRRYNWQKACVHVKSKHHQLNHARPKP